jgi:hypothetical protein
VRVLVELRAPAAPRAQVKDTSKHPLWVGQYKAVWQSYLVRTETSTELSSALLELEYGLTGAWGDCLSTETPRVSTTTLGSPP